MLAGAELSPLVLGLVLGLCEAAVGAGGSQQGRPVVVVPTRAQRGERWFAVSSPTCSSCRKEPGAGVVGKLQGGKEERKRELR